MANVFGGELRSSPEKVAVGVVAHIVAETWGAEDWSRDGFTLPLISTPSPSACMLLASPGNMREIYVCL